MGDSRLHLQLRGQISTAGRHAGRHDDEAMTDLTDFRGHLLFRFPISVLPTHIAGASLVPVSACIDFFWYFIWDLVVYIGSQDSHTSGLGG